MADYIIVNKTDLKKKLKELEYSRNVEPDNQMQNYLDGQIKSLEAILKESIPLNSEIGKAFDAGKYNNMIKYVPKEYFDKEDKNLWSIPTDKLSKLRFTKSTNQLNISSIDGPNTKSITNQHIYITNNEEIKDGNWCLYNKNHNSRNPIWELVKCGKIKREEMHPHTNGKLLLWMMKIIITTDSDLIEDGIQAIDNKFLEWFVKNPDCGFIKTKESKWLLDTEDKPYYTIIVPKEEILCEHCLSTTTCCDDIEAETCENMNRKELRQETLEKVKRTELFNSILPIVKKIPRKDVENDAMDALSCAYELEQLFYELQNKKLYNKEDLEKSFEAGRNYEEFLQSQKENLDWEGKIDYKPKSFDEWFKQI